MQAEYCKRFAECLQSATAVLMSGFTLQIRERGCFRERELWYTVCVGLEKQLHRDAGMSRAFEHGCREGLSSSEEALRPDVSPRIERPEAGEDLEGERL